MKSKEVRVGIAIFLLAFIFVFFVPIFPYKTPVVCPLGSHCLYIPSGTYNTGYDSLGLIVFNWGSSWSSGAQWPYYLPLPKVMISLETSLDQLTGGLGGLFLTVLPISLLAVALISPEIISGIRHLKLCRSADPKDHMERSVTKSGANREAAYRQKSQCFSSTTYLRTPYRV
ncbi:MAG: hypothetical protein JRN20_21370 [Nitrososphaerota archaeon]|nr:hypothetical protein [Nitrososphaerota archaeon]MDG6922216.1 hypothetical protein [Nitrososphaerota archaeon]